MRFVGEGPARDGELIIVFYVLNLLIYLISINFIILILTAKLVNQMAYKGPPEPFSPILQALIEEILLSQT